jgi:hypothetical protein
MTAFCAFEMVKATSRIDVKRSLWIVVVDLAIWEGGGRLNVKHDFSPILRTAQVLEF